MAAGVQNHIHLDGDKDGAPENGPTNKYSAGERRRTPQIFMNIKRMADGTLLSQRLDSGGSPVVGRSYEYTLHVDKDEIDALEADMGLKVYLVDHDHTADGDDHDSYIEDVYFHSMAPAKHLSPLLNKNTVRIRLVVDQ